MSIKLGQVLSTRADIFGRAFAELAGAPAPKIDIAAMPDAEQVCDCNGVSKGRICDAITAKGLASLDAVRAHTKASASCGSCTPKVEATALHWPSIASLTMFSLSK